MKTLKKTLCLVLAVVMAVGVLVIPAYATDFTDDAKIEHDEAVSVLSGLGIVNGIGDGSFNPDGTFTRAQAAALLANVVLTPDYAKELVSGSVKFSDVSAASGYAKYINWAVEEGYIHGYPDGTFKPDKELTGLELAALMLEVLDQELPTDGSYKNFVIQQTKKLGLNNGITGYVATAVISRDDAVQMMFNTMNYSPSGATVWNVTDASDALLETFDSIVDAYAFKAIYDESHPTAPATVTPGSVGRDTIFGKTYSVNHYSSYIDGFGRPGNLWVDKNAKTLYYQPKTAVREYHGPVTYKQIYADLGLTTATTAKLYIDGLARGDASEIVATAADHALNTNNGNNVGIADATAYGVETYVYENGKVSGVMTYKICQIVPYYATVSKVEGVDSTYSGVKTTTATFTISTPYFPTETRTSTDFVDFAKDDKVMLNMSPNAAGVVNVVEDAYKLDTITGTLTRIVNKNGVQTYTINGTEYKACFACGTLPASTDVGTEVTVRVDKFDNIVDTVGATAPAKTYILVLNKQTQGSTGWVGETSGTAQVYGILSDGTYGVYTVCYPGSNIYGYVANAVAVNSGEIYEYVATASGEILLLDNAADTHINETTAAISSGTASIGLDANGPAILNSDTLFIYYTKNPAGNSMTSFSTRVGNNNCGNISTGAKVVTKDNHVATVVFVGGSYSASVSTNEYAYIKSVADNITTEVVNGSVQTVYHFTGYKVDGTEVDLVSTLATKPVVAGLYLIGSDNSVAAANKQEVGLISGTTSSIVSGTVADVFGSTLSVTGETGGVSAAGYRGFTEGTYVYVGSKTAMKENTYVGIVNAAGNFTAIWFIG